MARCETSHQVVHLGSRRGIQASGGLIQKEKIGAERNGPRESRPFFHPAAEFRREIEFIGFKADHAELYASQIADRILRELRVEGDGKCDIFAECHRSDQSATLKHYPDAFQQRLPLFLAARGDTQPGNGDFAFGDRIKTDHVAKEGTFTTPAPAEDAQDFPFVYLKGHPVQDHVVPVACDKISNLDNDLFSHAFSLQALREQTWSPVTSHDRKNGIEKDNQKN